MFKSQLKQLTLFILLLIVASCSTTTDTDLLAGQGFTNTNIRVLSIDTFSVQLSTMKFDSITTSGNDRLLIGQYNDDYMGTVKAATYFKLNNSSYYLDGEAILDSVGLVLGYDTYFYNDTTQISSLNIHRLTEKISSEDSYLYNTSETTYESSYLANTTYTPTPNKDSLYVTLPYNFGLQLFNDIRDNNITDDESLYQQLKGLTVQPSINDNSSIIGFTTNSTKTYLRFFYSISNELEIEEDTFDLTISSSNLSYYNNIKSDVSGLDLESITNQEYNLPSIESNNLSFNQAGTGYVTRIEFPTLKNIYDIGGEGTILDATLYIEPNAISYSETQPIEETLLLYTVNQNNDLTEQIANNESFVSATLTNDNSEFNKVVYRIPIIDFIDKKLNETPETEDALILIPSNYNATVNKIIFNDSYNSGYKTQLIITYTIYE